MQKIISFHLFIFEIQAILESCDKTRHNHFGPHPSPPKIDQFLIHVNMYQHVKIGLFHSFFLEIKNPAIWEKLFQIWDLYRNTRNNINFHCRSNAVKINDQIFRKNLKSPIFVPFLVHFPNFRDKKMLS